MNIGLIILLLIFLFIIIMISNWLFKNNNTCSYCLSCKDYDICTHKNELKRECPIYKSPEIIDEVILNDQELDLMI